MNRHERRKAKHDAAAAAKAGASSKPAVEPTGEARKPADAPPRAKPPPPSRGFGPSARITSTSMSMRRGRGGDK
jgi:hypothetical protein